MDKLTRKCGAYKKTGGLFKLEKSIWTENMQNVPHKTKALIAVDTMYLYADHNKQ